jgi:hypothetical protein
MNKEIELVLSVVALITISARTLGRRGLCFIFETKTFSFYKSSLCIWAGDLGIGVDSSKGCDIFSVFQAAGTGL